MPAPKLGKQMKFYRNTATYDSPTWSAVCSVEDMNLRMVRNTAELKIRCSRFNRKLPANFAPFEIEAKFIHFVKTADMLAFRAGFLSEPPMIFDLVLLSGAPTEHSEGLRGPFFVEEFPQDQPLEDLVAGNMKLALTYAEDSNGAIIDPTWMSNTTTSGTTTTAYP